jgi:hypothetical protein
MVTSPACRRHRKPGHQLRGRWPVIFDHLKLMFERGNRGVNDMTKCYIVAYGIWKSAAILGAVEEGFNLFLIATPSFLLPSLIA